MTPEKPTYQGRQVAVHFMLGFIPAIKCREAVPDDHNGWEWGRWRMANFGEVMAINRMLLNLWRP